MTSISFTSGEILDIISALEAKEEDAYHVQNNPALAAYYMQIVNQFNRINDRLQERPGEKRVATMVLAA